MSRDPWEGDELRPLSRNGWSYVEGNPVNRTDPSGRCGPLTDNPYVLEFELGCEGGGSAVALPSSNAGFRLPPISLPRIDPRAIWGPIIGGCLYLGDVIHTQLNTETNARDIGTRVTRENIAKAEAQVIERAGNKGQLKILYRGTSLKRAFQPENPLWVSNQVFYVTVYAHFNAEWEKERSGERDTAAIGVYAIPTEVFNSLLISGNIRIRMGRDYGFDPIAQSFLIGPAVVPIPDYFYE